MFSGMGMVDGEFSVGKEWKSARDRDIRRGGSGGGDDSRGTEHVAHRP